MTQNTQLTKTTTGNVVMNRDRLSELLAQVDKQAAEVEAKQARETRATRRAAWAKDLEQIPMDKIENIDRIMSSFTERHVIERIEADEPRPLERDEVDRLADLYLDYEEIIALMEAKREEIRKLIFGHLDSTLNADEETPVEQVPGKVTSDTRKIVFSREGGKRKAPTIDWSALENKLGEDRFHAVLCVSEHVPEHTKYTPTEDNLLNAIQDGDLTLEDLRSAIIPGAWTTPRFVARKAK